MFVVELIQSLTCGAIHHPLESLLEFAALAVLFYFVANEIVRFRARLAAWHGPKGLPVVGNLRQLGGNASQKYREWAEEFGPVYQVQLGNLPVLVVNTAAAAKVMFGNNSQATASRPELYTFHKIVANTAGTTIGTSPYNESLKRRRKGAASALNRPSIETYIPHLDLETRDFLKDALAYGEGGALAIDPLPLVQRLSLSLAVTLNWGVRFPSHDDGLFKEITTVEGEISRTRSVTDNVQDYIPLLRLNPFSTGKRNAVEIRSRRDKYLSKLNDDLEEKIRNGTHDPCIQANVMLDEEAKLNNVELTSISLTMLSAGFETFTAVSSWGIAFLATHPEIQQKAFDAIQETYDETNPLCDAYDDQTIPYIRAFVRECLRYFTVLRLSLPRSTNKEFVYEGKPIPKGTMVFLNSWACNMDKELWHDAEAFRPERWLESPEAPMFTYGMGYRMCAGTMLANRELYITFVRMLAGFELSSTTKIDTDPITGAADLTNLIIAPARYKVTFTPRNETALRASLESEKTH
ncbi:cytochrome P450 [Colletotrichum zoysiae]|uniref:Cytochrome P450 n=1 Tax=Colletotrichum zoysiae TaxID=1216348 RepID=A0AAD9H8E3_9PEZI|nr:cytochrome P450 [Colletotrichum zoysiae]